MRRQVKQNVAMNQANAIILCIAKRSWIAILLIAPLSFVYIAVSRPRPDLFTVSATPLQVEIRSSETLTPEIVLCFSRCGSMPVNSIKNTPQTGTEKSTVLTGNQTDTSTINDSSSGEVTSEKPRGKGPNPQQPSPTIYIVTPTYRRPTQIPDLIRMAYTLMHVPNIMWLVVEDSSVPTEAVTSLLQRTGIPHHRMHIRAHWVKGKTLAKAYAHRMESLKWIRNNVKSGILYFADDDNAYDVRVFEEMRSTKKVSVWPVGLIGTYGVSTPIVRNGTIIGFHDSFKGRRTFAVDMAGFAVNVEFLLKQSKAKFYNRLGYLEDSFLKSLGIKINELEPKAANCTQVYVWHTKTMPSVFPKKKYLDLVRNSSTTNVATLYKNILKYS